MPFIADLLERLPAVKDVNMTSSGIALWICWEGDLDAAVPQTLQDYGGMCIITDHNQSMWYFFTTDVFLALARLTVWANFNPLPVNIQALPARILFSVRREVSISLEAGLTQQEVMVPQKLGVWIHPKTREGLGNSPGLTFTATPHNQGMAVLAWEVLEADSRLPYTSSQGWYALLKPLGNPLDKAFQTAWRATFVALEKILQRHKFKYNVHDFFLMLPIDNLRQLRIWARELLLFTSQQKEHPETYWPCVSVIMNKKGMNFNNELPQKVGVKWDSLMPDFPYMSYRNAFLLGEGFSITDLHYSAGNTTIDNWCTVSLGEDQLAVGNYIPILVAGQTTAGDGPPCFYCGMYSHTAAQCPTKRLRFSTKDYWEEFSTMGIEEINEGFRVMEDQMLENGVNGLRTLYDSTETPGTLVRTIFEVGLPSQLRVAERLWLNISRDFPEVTEELGAVREAQARRDESPAWGFLERLAKLHPQDLGAFEKDVLAAINRTPRDVRLRTLLGFSAMERGDYTRAQAAWKEAENLSGSPLHQAWHTLLLGRLHEIQNRFSDAQDCYREAFRLHPNWREPEYRQVVCQVKMGFAEQMQPQIFQLIGNNPHFFNRFLIDSELERGHLIILTTLYSKWSDAKRMVEDERTHIDRLHAEVDEWFPREHMVANKFRERLETLRADSGMNNYLAFLQVITARPLLERDIKAQVQQEIEILKARFKQYLGVLESIRDEAAWFPFPRVLVEFNREFNECAGIINWAFASNFHTPANFRQAQEYVPQIVTLLQGLERRLRFLRVLRDSTLYILILGRTFLWIEVTLLALAIVIVPGIAIFGHEFGLGWLRSLIRANHWELQGMLFLVVTAVAMGLAALRSTLIFERKRNQLVEEARHKREEMQRQRLDKIKERLKV